MSKYRRAAKIDVNQPQIIEDLEAAGFTVDPGRDDIFVGKYGVNLWVEIKSMDTWLKSGGLKSGTLKPSQIKLLQNWKGHYMVAWTSAQIINEMNRVMREVV